MVRRVSGHMQHVEREAFCAHRVAVGEDTIGHEGRIDEGIAETWSDRASCAACRPERSDLSAEHGLQRAGAVAMVAMTVRDEDVGQAFAPDRRSDCLAMRLVVGPRIDDRDLAGADDIAVGAEKGVRAGIVGDDAADAGRDLLRHAIIDIDVAVEGKLRRHGSKAAFLFSPKSIVAEPRAGGIAAFPATLSSHRFLRKIWPAAKTWGGASPRLFPGVRASRRASRLQSTMLVGVGRFELPTPCSRSRCATRLRYTPAGERARYIDGSGKARKEGSFDLAVARGPLLKAPDAGRTAPLILCGRRKKTR
jgi:hypothetical protein